MHSCELSEPTTILNVLQRSFIMAVWLPFIKTTRLVEGSAARRATSPVERTQHENVHLVRR